MTPAPTEDAAENLITTFEALQTRLDALCNAITKTDAQLPAWSKDCPPKGAVTATELNQARRSLAKHIGNLWHPTHDEPKRQPGLIACSKNTIALLHTLNLEKAQFEHLIVGLRKTYKAPTATLAQLLSIATGHSAETMTFALNTAGMKHINLSFCYRRVQQLPDTIASVSWTWSSRSRSIKSLSVVEATALAQDKLAGQSTQQAALNQLQRLPLDTPLAVVRPVQPSLKANLTFEDMEKRTVRKIITAHSPLFVLDTGDALPRKNWPGYPQGDALSTRLGRSHRFLAPKPAIAALNLYRYLDE